MLSRNLSVFQKAKYLFKKHPQFFLVVFMGGEFDSEAIDQFEFRSTWGKKGSNVSHRRLAEEAAVFAIELRSTFVADLKSRTGGIKTTVQHQAPR